VRRRTIRLIGVVLCVVGTAMWAYTPLEAAAPLSAQTSAQSLRLGSVGDDVREVQEALRTLGYAVRVDGRFGTQTERVVRHWQRANGLMVDGIVGAATLRSLEIAAPGSGTGRAVRGSAVRVQPAPAPPPAVSSYTGPCSEWASAMEFFGLPPETFGPIMYRESRCRPDVTSSTGCCHGLLQVHRIHLPKPECRAYSQADLFDPAINICVASILFKRSGLAPWRLG
jgi:hypothetical protein